MLKSFFRLEILQQELTSMDLNSRNKVIATVYAQSQSICIEDSRLVSLDFLQGIFPETYPEGEYCFELGEFNFTDRNSFLSSNVGNEAMSTFAVWVDPKNVEVGKVIQACGIFSPFGEYGEAN